jgi:transcriptional regulator GlxA family with amidase domain
MARLCALVVGNLADFGAKLAIAEYSQQRSRHRGCRRLPRLWFLGFLDILGLAREVILSRTGEVPFDVVTASETGRAVTDGHGRSLEVQKRLSDIERCAAIVVQGFVPQGMKLPDMSAYADAAGGFAASTHMARSHAPHAAGSTCWGAGLLDGRRCTTTWWLHDEPSTAIRAATRRGDRR